MNVRGLRRLAPLVLTLATLLAACAASRGLGADARFDAVKDTLSAMGLSQLRPADHATIAPGGEARRVFDLAAGCVTFVVVGDENVRDVDVTVLDSADKSVAHDTTRAPQAIVRVCSDVARKYTLVVTARSGGGVVTIGVWSGATPDTTDGGAPVPSSVTTPVVVGTGTCASPIEARRRRDTRHTSDDGRRERRVVRANVRGRDGLPARRTGAGAALARGARRLRHRPLPPPRRLRRAVGRGSLQRRLGLRERFAHRPRPRSRDLLRVRRRASRRHVRADHARHPRPDDRRRLPPCAPARRGFVGERRHLTIDRRGARDMRRRHARARYRLSLRGRRARASAHPRALRRVSPSAPRTTGLRRGGERDRVRRSDVERTGGDDRTRPRSRYVFGLRRRRGRRGRGGVHDPRRDVAGGRQRNGRRRVRGRAPARRRTRDLG